jgi:hypothetical protein
MDILNEDSGTEHSAVGRGESNINGPTVLYRVVQGYRHGQSLALWCAKNALVPQRTLSRGMAKIGL